MDFESNKHLLYGKALLDFAKGAAKEYIRTKGDGHALIRFIENSKTEANGRIFSSRLLWSLLVDCYEPVPPQIKTRHCDILDFGDCHTYRDVCLCFEHSYFLMYQASKTMMLADEICA
jgi:hypothetical protein